MAFKLALLFGVIALASACSYAPGTTTTTVTTTTTTVSDDDSDAGLLLGSHDRSVIRKTWDQARRDGDVAPQILFRFISAHPEYQKMFTKFSGVPMNELMTNGNFLAQAYTILAGLNVVIQSLSSSELMASQLNALGGAHQPRGATPVMFEQFGAVLEEVLAEELGSTFNAEAGQAWKHGLAALVAGISKTLKNPEDLVDPQTKLSTLLKCYREKGDYCRTHQIRDVQRSWENLRKGRNAIVSGIMIKLFKETPRVQKYFAKFGQVPVDSLTGNAEFNKQVALVADRLDAIISAMDDKLQLLGNINYMRYTHAARSIPRGPWEDFARLLVDALSAGGVSADDLESWKGALRVFVNGIAPKN